MTILIVEDDPGIAELLAEQLEERGYTTISALSGAMALAILKAQQPYMMILDYSLPDMSASALIDQLKASGQRIPPFIVSTGQGDERIAVEMMKLGARDYVIKDRYFLERLPEVVRRVDKEIENDRLLKQAEEKRIELERQMQHAQKLESLGVLAGGIAHDFNNLLTTILGYADLAKLELTPNNPAFDYIEEVVKGARQAAELARQMLAYSGKGRFLVQPINLSGLVEEMRRLLEISISKKCVLRFEFANDLPLIEADVSQMRQVIMNLVINASEAIGERSGVIAIRTSLLFCDRAYLSETYIDEQLPEGLYAYLEVADNGIGMTPETRAKVFDPFFTTKMAGRGLGLAAVLGIVRGHRSAIKVDSVAGQGTTFRILLPVTDTSIEVVTPPAPEQARWAGQGIVLIVDDEETVRGLARVMFERMGFSVLTAVDGYEGVEIFRREVEGIRLVLLDMMMPHMDGEEAFNEMQRIQPDVCAILSSGYNEQAAVHRFAGKGLAGFIQKPYRYADLQTVVRKALNA